MLAASFKEDELQYDLHWKHRCRLCACKDLLRPDENTSMAEKQTQKSSSANIQFLEQQHVTDFVKDLMKVDIVLGQEPKYCCGRCMQRIQDLVEYVAHVRKVQKMYEKLWEQEKSGQRSKRLNVCQKYKIKLNEKETVGSAQQILPDKVALHADDMTQLKDVHVDPLHIEVAKEAATTAVEKETEKDKDGTEQSESSSVEEWQKTRSTLKLKTPATSKSNTTALHTCSKCQRRYKIFSHYRRHMRQQHKQHIPPTHCCVSCSRTFPTALQLQAHAKTHLPLELKQDYACLHCSKKFTTPYVLMKHISSVHLNEKPYICEECGLPLKSNSSLKSHMMTHSDERPHKCEHCTKGFKNYPALKRHMEGHSSRKFVCSACGFQLGSSASLKRHMVIHSDVKLFKCEFCEQQFKRAEAYKHHLLLHTGLKPYACNFCERTFAHGSNCRSHLKKTHAQELAEFERQAGKVAAFKNTLPKMEHLKAITQNANNIYHVNSKQKVGSADNATEKQQLEPAEERHDDQMYGQSQAHEVVINVTLDAAGEVNRLEML